MDEQRGRLRRRAVGPAMIASTDPAAPARCLSHERRKHPGRVAALSRSGTLKALTLPSWRDQMFRQDVAECAALVAKADLCCEIGDPDRARTYLAQVLEILMTPTSEEQRKKWREQKARQRATASTTTPSSTAAATPTGPAGRSVSARTGVDTTDSGWLDPPMTAQENRELNRRGNA